MNIQLESPAFKANAHIPALYTCDGRDISPPLSWKDPEEGTRSYVLIVNDPDAPAGDWVHWILFNIPATTKNVAEGSSTPAEAISGLNSWGSTGYKGPCPPTGVHRYFFRLYALNTVLNLDAHASLKDIVQAMENHIISQGELVGLYARQ